MSNPTMFLPGHHFIAATDPGIIIRRPEFRLVDGAGFELNVNTTEHPIWRPCGEPVGIPAGVNLNHAVLDGNGARAR